MSAAEPASVAHAKRTVMGRLSLILGCKSLLHGAGEPRLHAVSAIPALAPEVYMPTPLNDDFGAVGFTHEQAFMGAVGECVERYCASFCDPEATLIASKNELGEAAIGMDQFALYSEEQYAAPGFPFARMRPDVPVRWARGRSLVTGKTRYVPAATVYIPYRAVSAADWLCLAVSSGQACHTRRERAILTGLFEVIERDAFMISWLRKLAVPEVDFMRDPHLADMHARYLAGAGLRFRVFDMTLDVGIPSMVCVVEGESARGTIRGVGAATRSDPRAAVEKALLEAAQGMVWCRDLIRRRPTFRPSSDWSEIKSFEDHVRLYCEPDMGEHLRFFMDSGVTKPLPPSPVFRSEEEELAACVQTVAKAGLECVVVDVTTREIADAGFFAPKVIIPSAVALTAAHDMQSLGSPRLWSAPERAGYRASASRTLNPIPHPFP